MLVSVSPFTRCILISFWNVVSENATNYSLILSFSPSYHFLRRQTVDSQISNISINQSTLSSIDYIREFLFSPISAAATWIWILHLSLSVHTLEFWIFEFVKDPISPIFLLRKCFEFFLQRKKESWGLIIQYFISAIFY